jgi:hypothetical protein
VRLLLLLGRRYSTNLTKACTGCLRTYPLRRLRERQLAHGGPQPLNQQSLSSPAASKLCNFPGTNRPHLLR